MFKQVFFILLLITTAYAHAQEIDLYSFSYYYKIASEIKPIKHEDFESRINIHLSEILQDVKSRNLDKKALLISLNDRIKKRVLDYKQELSNPNNRKQFCLTQWGLYKQIFLASAKVIACMGVAYAAYRIQKSANQQAQIIRNEILPVLGAQDLYEGSSGVSAWGPSEIKPYLKSLALNNSFFNEAYITKILAIFGTIYYMCMGLHLFNEIYAQEFHDQYCLISALIEKQINLIP